MKHFALATVTLILLAGVAAPAPADEPAARSVALEDVELLPIHEIEWGILLLEHPKLVERLMFLGKRMQRVGEHLRERERPTDAGSKALREELERLAARIARDLERILVLAEPFGIDADVLAPLKDAPRGRLRLERHAIRLVLSLPDLIPRQRALHERLVPAVEGALLALDEGEEGVRHEIQVRFWRVVDATLTPQQSAALRRRLPTKAAKYTDLLGHVFLLEGLTVEQAMELKALLVRTEQETAPDQVLAARDGAEKTAAQRRLVALAVAAWREGNAVLTPAQRLELRAVPPMLAAKDRPGDLEHDFASIDFTADQHPALASLQRRYGPVKGIVAQRLVALALEAQDMGPDTPQREALETRRAQIYGDALRAARAAARELFGVVLTPEQILTWVVRRE